MQAMRFMRPAVIFCCLVFLASGIMGQEKGQNKSNKKKKKKPAPFQWVNPMTKWEVEKCPGVKHSTFKSPTLKVEVGYCIYLPADYHLGENKLKRYPVVYYLHGGRPGNEKKGIKLSAEIDRRISAKEIPPMIYVFVNGGPVSHYNMPNEPTKQGADVFIKELIPHVDATYRTIPERKGRGLEGFSQGGRGTARLMFRYPELFCSASPGGGGHETERKISENGGAESDKLVFAKGDNTWDLARQYAKRLKSNDHDWPELKILVHVGDQGFNYQNNLQWMKHLDALGIKHQKLIVPDVGHSAAGIYQKNGTDIMSFHAQNFGLKNKKRQSGK